MPRQIEASKVNSGTYIMLDGEPCEVRSMSKSSPGKHGSAKCKIKARGVFDDKDRHVTKPGDAMLMSPDVDKKIGQVVSREGDIAQVMDMDTYETEEMELPEDLNAGEGDEIEYWVIDDRKLVKGLNK
ncbi:translation initiation factor IF-5A [Candidatus Nanohaloarchaea archaeon]|nr:translation initiation factor IF-5A [Candidatus Nanohaloarchaea archaeon]